VLLMDRLNHAMVTTERRGGQLALLFVDLDRIKAVNDKLGHSVGDSLLRDVAVRLKQVVREVDTVARLGGDEFIVLLDDVADADEAGVVAEKIAEALNSSPFIIEQHRLRATCSIGISLFPTHAANADTLLRNADAAMYKAKERGRNGYCFFAAD
jgi:diguanylate cyclase (GGDEF)-like protein